ncbi:hypothetical protein ACQVA2_11640 [Citrobacter sp. OP27]
MAQSFVRQGVNIICSNMTVSSPRKLGLHPDKVLVKTAGITINTVVPAPLLNILDKKLDDCFKCKMPKKVWGGLASFFAGVAIVAIVIVVVVTAPVSGPIVAAIAGVATVTSAIVVGSAAAVGGIASTIYAVYKLSHECDRVFDAQWVDFHNTVLFEKQYALLNHSFLKCPVGGKLNIIISDPLASQAARLLSSANNKEVWLQWTSKFITGVLAFGFGNPIGVTIASGMEIYSTMTDNGLSNQRSNLLDEAEKATQDHAVSTTAEEAIKHSLIRSGGMMILNVAIYAEGKGILTTAQANTVLDWLVSNGKVFSWNDLGAEFKKGIVGALCGFVVDQVSNGIEDYYEQKSGQYMRTFNSKDQNDENNIKVIATKI